MTFPPTDTRPGADACAGADVCAQPGVDSPTNGWPDADVWVDEDGVPSAAQLAVWFAHPSAVLDDTWAHATPATAAPAPLAPAKAAPAAVVVGVDVDDAAGMP